MPQQQITIHPLGSAPIDIPQLLIHLAVGVALSLITCWHFRRFSSTLANRQQFTLVIPFVMLTTILIIAVVKSSIALSLGLVGALSIVRFRTPIKEPEELAYLFIGLAMGVGLGAGQVMPTATAGLVILGVMAGVKSFRSSGDSKNLYLSIDLNGDDAERSLADLNDIVSQHADDCDLRRFDSRNGGIEATYFVDVANTDALTRLSDALRTRWPAIGITFLDQSRIPSV